VRVSVTEFEAEGFNELCVLDKYRSVQEYERPVSFISNGTDDECGVRKQPIAVVRCLLDKRNLYHRLR
jgi:hypothetical protein